MLSTLIKAVQIIQLAAEAMKYVVVLVKSIATMYSEVKEALGIKPAPTAAEVKSEGSAEEEQKAKSPFECEGDFRFEDYLEDDLNGVYTGGTFYPRLV